MDFSLTPVANYRSPIGQAARAPVVVLGAGRQQARGTIGNRRLASFGALLLSQGRGTLWSETTGELAVAAPALIWLFPEIAHSYGPSPGESWTEAWTLFDGNLPRDAVHAGYISPVRPVLTPAQPAALQRLFQLLVTEFETLAPAQAGLLVHELLLTPHLVAADAVAQDAAMEEAAALLAQDNQVSLPTLAASLNMAPATLRRRFVARHGLPPKAYQLRLRLDRAKEMLTLTDRSIEHIAQAAGFADSYYFSRLFHDREGCSPSAFRLQHRRG